MGILLNDVGKIFCPTLSQTAHAFKWHLTLLVMKLRKWSLLSGFYYDLVFFVHWNRETPLHQLYSSAFSKQKLEIYPTKKPALPFGDLPPGYQHLHTQLQYECISPFYRRLGSSRRTCLKTGKWSGRAPVCIPSESPGEKNAHVSWQMGQQAVYSQDCVS